jgi:hypothetical protein
MAYEAAVHDGEVPARSSSRDADGLPRMQGEPVIEGLRRHLEPRHQRPEVEEVERAPAEEVPRVGDRAEAVVVLDVDERRGEQPRGDSADEKRIGERALSGFSSAPEYFGDRGPCDGSVDPGRSPHARRSFYHGPASRALGVRPLQNSVAQRREECQD